jgi:hypothetical protein
MTSCVSVSTVIRVVFVITADSIRRPRLDAWSE